MTLVNEWVEKAEADFKGAVALNRLRKEPLPNLVCYHCQQSTEKYLKAYLIAQDVTPPRIHDLVQLLNLCSPHHPQLSKHLPLAQELNSYGVLIRDPGLSATIPESKDAVKTMRCLRATLRHRLGL